MTKRQKRESTLTGNLLGPLIVGQKAVIETDQKVVRTSRVLRIEDWEENRIQFETDNIRYLLFLRPLPYAAVCSFATGMAACA